MSRPERIQIGDWFAALPFQARHALVVATFSFCVTMHFVHLDSSLRILNESPMMQTAEVLYVPDERMSRLMMLGYDQAAADLLWLRTLGYFGHHFASDRQYEWLEFFIEQILALDPRFHKVYHWAGANVLYGRRFTNDNVLTSNRFYEAALERFPDDHEAAYRLGLNYYIELRSKDPVEQRGYKEQGLSYLEMAANMPTAPHRLRNLVASVATKLGKTQIAVQSLLDLLVQETDPEARRALQLRIERLKSGVDASELAAAANGFRAAHDATFPYTPDVLFMHLGEPTHKRWQDVSWRTLLPDIAVEGGDSP